MLLRLSFRGGGVALLVVGSAALAAVACSETPPGVPTGDASADRASLPFDAGPAPDADAGDATSERDPCTPAGPSLCSPSAAWEAPTSVLRGKFLAITPDELHLAVLEADDGGNVARIYDRANVGNPFVAGQAFGFPVDATGASLSRDGKLLLYTFGQRPQLSARAEIGAAFGPPSTSAFQFGDEGQLYRAPVFLENDGFFLTTFGASVGQQGFTLVDKVDSVYRIATMLYPQPELENTSDGGAAVKSPTGMSKDLRTLFFYDEEKRVTKAAFRPVGGSECPYTTFVDLGDRPFATPNAACTAIYYDDPVLGVARMARKP